MKDMIMKPKIWLVVIAVMHALMGVIATSNPSMIRCKRKYFSTTI